MESRIAAKRPRALLLTGAPGTGKTTVLRRAAEMLAGLEIRGFTTGEIRRAGERLGFRIETFGGDGAADVLAHVDIKSPYRVGKYGVDVDALDSVIAAQFSRKKAGVVFIDEIGRMECFSPRFVEAVDALLDSARVFVATIALRGGGFIDAVKRRPGVELWTVGRANRDEMPAKVVEWVRERIET